MNDLETDVLVIGSGVAGASVALGLAGVRRVVVLDHGEGSTRWAQGGIAAVVDPEDDVRAHADDTIRAGAGLCDPDAVSALVAGGMERFAVDVIRCGLAVP